MKPDGFVWHDSEMPHAAYPTTCAKCGRYARTTYCNDCCDELLRKESIAREAERRRYWKQFGGAR